MRSSIAGPVFSNLIIFILILSWAGCGVKGAPLPPEDSAEDVSTSQNATKKK